MIVIINKALSKINNKILFIGAIIFVAVVGIFWVNYIKVPVRADQKMVYTYAIYFIHGDFNGLELPNYLAMHPLQLGIVLFTESVYRIFSLETPLVFQNLNIIFVLLCNVFLYKICNIIYKNQKANKVLLIFLLLFVLMPMLSVLVYGNIVGLVFSLIAIYFTLKYIDERKKRYIFLMPIFMTISIALKENYEIILIAICIILFIDFLNEYKKLALIGIILALVLVKFVNPFIFKIVEFRTNKEINEGTPMISYIAMAMYPPIDRQAGWYNAEFNVESVYSDNNFDIEKTKSQSLDVIKNRVKVFIENPKEFFEYYRNKISSTWLEPSFQVIWTSEAMEETTEEIEKYYNEQKLIPSMLTGKISKVFMKYFDILEISIFGLSALCILNALKNKEINYKNVILIIIFLGGFLFHILWETKCIYAFPFYYLLLPSASKR